VRDRNHACEFALLTMRAHSTERFDKSAKEAPAALAYLQLARSLTGQAMRRREARSDSK